jgi:hypothetical protein
VLYWELKEENLKNVDARMEREAVENKNRLVMRT